MHCVLQLVSEAASSRSDGLKSEAKSDSVLETIYIRGHQLEI